jgi:hypothetical protein
MGQTEGWWGWGGRDQLWESAWGLLPRKVVEGFVVGRLCGWSVHPSIDRSFDPSTHPSIVRSFHPTIHPSIHTSLDRSFNPSIQPPTTSIHPSISFLDRFPHARTRGVAAGGMVKAKAVVCAMMNPPPSTRSRRRGKRGRGCRCDEEGRAIVLLVLWPASGLLWSAWVGGMCVRTR